MADTLTDYISESEDWDEKELRERLNVVITYVIDLEKKVERLESQTKETVEEINRSSEFGGPL